MFSLHFFLSSYIQILPIYWRSPALKIAEKIVPPQSQCITRGVFPNLFLQKNMQSYPQLINHLGLCRFQMYLMEIIVPIVLHDCGLSSHQFPWHKNENLSQEVCVWYYLKKYNGLIIFLEQGRIFWKSHVFWNKTCLTFQSCFQIKNAWVVVILKYWSLNLVSIWCTYTSWGLKLHQTYIKPTSNLHLWSVNLM